MFNWVKFSISCPHCGKKVSQFQTKDGDCYLTTVLPHEVNSFHTSCPSCDAWLECEYEPPKGIGRITITASKQEPKVGKVKGSDRTVTVQWNTGLGKKGFGGTC
jgi:hypothetical protein